MSNVDVDVIAPLLLEYYDWLSGHGGTDPEVLLSKDLTRPQRKLLLTRMDDLNVIYGITAPLRHVSQAGTPQASGSNWQ